jgi:hypothetical protein
MSRPAVLLALLVAAAATAHAGILTNTDHVPVGFPAGIPVADFSVCGFSCSGCITDALRPDARLHKNQAVTEAYYCNSCTTQNPRENPQVLKPHNAPPITTRHGNQCWGPSLVQAGDMAAFLVNFRSPRFVDLGPDAIVAAKVYTRKEQFTAVRGAF